MGSELILSSCTCDLGTILNHLEAVLRLLTQVFPEMRTNITLPGVRATIEVLVSSDYWYDRCEKQKEDADRSRRHWITKSRSYRDRIGVDFVTAAQITGVHQFSVF